MGGKPEQQDRARALSSWLLEEGLEGSSQATLLEGYCERLVALGVPLARVHVAQRTYHPQFGGFGRNWVRGVGLAYEEYGHTDAPSQQWLNSPLYHLLSDDVGEMRERMEAPGHQSRFPFLTELQSRGMTDYFAKRIIFDRRQQVGGIDSVNIPRGVLVSWCSDGRHGFSDMDLKLIRSVVPELGLALKSASNRQMAEDLLQVYLGRDAGTRVLSGEIRRGSLSKINAVICYFDLTGFTRLAEQVPGDTVIAMLNDYFGIAVSSVQQAGGNVLKFMGDGLLAMFGQEDPALAARAALSVAATLRGQMEDTNRRRMSDGLPVAGYTLALHAGEILYGNIGGENRLDFTVIGPAVNLAARLSGMHKALGQVVVISEAVQSAGQGGEFDLVPLGRYMLRGESEPQMLYTLYDPCA